MGGRTSNRRRSTSEKQSKSRLRPSAPFTTSRRGRLTDAASIRGGAERALCEGKGLEMAAWAFKRSRAQLANPAAQESPFFRHLWSFGRNLMSMRNTLLSSNGIALTSQSKRLPLPTITILKPRRPKQTGSSPTFPQCRPSHVP